MGTPNEFDNGADLSESETQTFDVDTWLNLYWDELARTTKAELRVTLNPSLAASLGRPSMEGQTVVLDRVNLTISTTSGKVLETLPRNLLDLADGPL